MRQPREGECVFCDGLRLAKDEQKPPSAEQPISERRGGEEQGAQAANHFLPTAQTCTNLSVVHLRPPLA